MSVPIGLQFGRNPGEIIVRSQYGFSESGQPQFGMAVSPSQTLGLLGGNLSIEDGGLISPSGRIELGSMGDNVDVAMIPTTPDWKMGWKLDYANVQKFQNIHFDRDTLVFAIDGGDIQLQGKQIRLSNGAQIGTSTSDATKGGDFKVNASESIVITGRNPDGAPSVIFTQVIGRTGTGQGGDLTIVAPDVEISEGGILAATTFSQGNAGNLLIDTARLRLSEGGQAASGTFAGGNSGQVTIRASERIEISGFYPRFSLGSGIFTSSEARATGNGGRIDLQTNDLQIKDGGKIAANTLNKGNAGEISIRANTVTISGNQRDFAGTVGGIVTSVGRRSTGQGGNINLQANRLQLLDGGQITADTSGGGKAGDVKIQADDITVSGTTVDRAFTSQISATSSTTAAAGSIFINTDRLAVQNQGTIAVSGLSIGDAGNLVLNAKTLELKDSGSLSATVNAGNKGNIQITSKLLLMRRNNSITSNASALANGGNITIDSPIIIGLENSDIVANAIQGQGGKINITTQSIFGLKSRPQITPDNDITASSELGLNGTIEVNNIGIDPNDGLTQLPVDLVDASQQIARGCNREQSASFVITGRGGIPTSPTQSLNTDRPWQDSRNILPSKLASSISPPELIEATSWQLSPQGQPQLIAGKPIGTQPNLTCAR